MNILRFVLNLLFPPRCVFCDRIMEPNTEICICGECTPRPKLCADSLCCVKCGKPIVTAGESGQCYSCMNTTGKYFDRIASVFVYGGLVKESIHRYKIEGIKSYSYAYASCMQAKLYEEYGNIVFDLMCGTPSHGDKAFISGFDHTDELCRRLSPLIDVRYESGLLFKTRETLKQSMLSFEERKTNLTDSIAVNADFDIKGSTVLLVDDICTTKATIIECSRALKAAGAKRVYALTLATSVKKSDFRKYT